MNRRRWTLVLWCLSGLGLCLILCKFFVADVYRVETGSMRPTLFGGRARPDAQEDSDHVLVLYQRDPLPERFDLVVLRSRDGGLPLVKRVCGMPGDDLSIVDGDLLLRGRRLPPEVPRPEPITVYDDRFLEAESFFERRSDGSVRRENGEWVVDGGTQPPGSLLLYHPPLRDDYLDRDHQRVPGLREVNDAVLELEFRLEELGAGLRLRFQLAEAGDTFEVRIDLGEDHGVLSLDRHGPGLRNAGAGTTPEPPPPEETLAEIEIRPEAGRWYDLLFSNVDNALTVRCPGLGVALVRTYAENEPWPTPLPPGRRSLGPRLGFGAESGRARFRSVRVRRDLYYTDDGTYGVASAIALGPGEYFLLGDNSAASTDSRIFGPVSRHDLIGRPLAVVWPEPRWLFPVREP